jgi:hypothetical protein
VVNGNPAIAAWRGGTIVFQRSDNSTGSNWPGGPTTIGNSSAYIPGPIPQLDMAIVDGNPAVVYHHNNTARYCRATNSNGAAWPASLVADNGSGIANVGAYPSLAVIDNNPAIASYDYTNGALRFTRASTTTGASAIDWPASQIVDNSSSMTGLFTSLKAINGRPAISYWDLTNDSLKYIQANDSSGSSWPASTVVDSDECGDWNCLLQVNGQPAISYYTGNGGNLRYIRFY